MATMEIGTLSGKTAIVTGAGRGLGRSMALGLARAGATVVLTAARNRSEIDAVAEEAAKSPAAGATRQLLADVASAEDCGRAVEETVLEFGTVHILVNNAGRGMRFVSEKFFDTPTKFWETDPAVWNNDHRHERQRPVPDVPRRRAAHAEATLGPHRQHFHQPRNHAPRRLLPLRPVKGRARIRDHHLGPGFGRHRSDRE